MYIEGYQHYQKSIQDINLSFYDNDREAQQILVILHGWNVRGLESWQSFLASAQKELGVRIVAIEMPGFGQSSLPPDVWGVGEYAQFIHEFIQENFASSSTHISLLGHSFGGGVVSFVAAQNAQYYNTLILLAPAVIRSQKNHTKKQNITKLGKRLFELPPSI
jgi:abhydrolase domain-containing protein 6